MYKRMGRTCCVSECKSGKKVPSHKFLKDSIIRGYKWIKSLNLHHLEHLCANELQKYHICHKHFHEKDYSLFLPFFMLNTAIPRFNINSTNDNIDIDPNNVKYATTAITTSFIKRKRTAKRHLSHLQKQVQQYSKQLSEQQHSLDMLHI